MAIQDEANRLANVGQSQAATDLLSRAADSGDPEAMFALANWRLFGLNGPRDIPAAHALLRRAGDRGHSKAIQLGAALLLSGTGCTSDVAKASRMLARIKSVEPLAAFQLIFAEKMPSEWKAAKLPVETLSHAPVIRSVTGLLSAEECRYIITMATPNLEPSYVLDPATGRRVPHPIRTSKGTSFGPTREDLVIHKLNRRLARVTGTDVSWGEPLHILSYAPGQEYRPHLDALPGTANQRHWTVLVYLNEDYSGGATRFDVPGIEFRGRTGDALIFRNVDEQGTGDPATRHAGLPVTQGTKWLATRWIRQAPYHPWTRSD